jgi:hypothetical protein
MISTTLHMGLPKTASTTMQVFFHQNRRLLADRNVLYPRSLGNTAHRKLLLLADCKEYGRYSAGEDHLDASQNRKIVLNELQQELSDNRPERVILSCENMPRVSATTYRKLRHSLEECSLRVDQVILYLRPQADWRRSVIQQRIKVGIWDSEHLYPVDPPEACGIYGCYRDHVKRRASAFGAGSIKLRLFGSAYFKDGDFYRELKEAFALPEAPYRQIPPANESLSDFACRMLLHLNRNMPRYTPSGRACNRRAQIRRAAIKYLGASEAALGKASLPAETLERYERYYAESNEWIRRNFFPETAVLFSHQRAAEHSKSIEHSSALVARARRAAEDVQGIQTDEAIDQFFMDLRQELLATNH